MLHRKFNISPKNRIQQIDNIIVVFNVIEKEFATQIVGCTPYGILALCFVLLIIPVHLSLCVFSEVVDANTKRIMGVLNSLAQVARKRLPTLQQPGTIEPTAADEEEEEDDEEDDEDDDEDDDDGATTEPAAASATAAAAAAAPAASAEVTAVDQMKQQFVAGFRRRRDTVSVESVAVAELLRERKEDVVADGSGVNTPSPRSVRDIVSAMNSANPSPRQAQVGSNKSSPRIDVPAAVAVAPEVVVTAVAASEVPTAVEGAAGADAAGTAAPAGEVDAIATLEAQNDTKTRKWKRFSNAMQANNTLGSYAARYKSTDEAAILAAEEADRAALKPDDASHYAADSRRVLVRTTEGSASGDAFDVPVWIEPSATYDDVVCQIDARIWAQQAAGVERHHSNRRRPFSAPLVLYVATKQRGLLGSLADVGEELMPHAIASALADEGDEATYEYRVLVDDPHLLEPAESETQQRKDKRKKRKVKRAAAAAAAVDEGGADGDSAADGAADGVPANGYGTVVRKKRTKVLKKKSGDHDVVDDEGDAEQADDADAATAATVATANGDDATTADSDAAAASATATTATTDDDADDNDDEAVKVSEKKTKTKTKKKSMIAGDSTPTQVRKNEASKADEAVAEQNEEAALAAEAARRALKRNEIAREVLTSERKYVQDGLDVLLAMFLEPLRTNGIVTKEEVKLIFGDIEAIRNYNVMLLDQLEKRMQKWDESQQMGDIFQSAVPFLKVYTVYVNKYNSALETLVECRTKNKKMAAFLEKQTSSARCNGLDIGSYLIMPIQRIPRYVLLLQELLKFTEPAHVDYAGLQMATTKMREVADYVNERKREAENLAQVSLVAKLITGSSETIAAPHRRFVTQAALGVAVTPTTYDATVEPKPYFVVLFNDMLVFAKTNAKIRKGKGAARSVQLASDEQVEECAREHKYVARVMLQHYGLVDGQALTATGGGNDITADTAANDAGWDIVTLTTSVKSSTKKTYPDIASHCLRLEPLLPIHELPLAPDTSADGFLARAFYRLYMSSELEKRQWALALDDAMCALLDSEVSRRLDTIKLARLEATPALAKAAFDNPEKRGTLYKRGKDGQWKERVFVLQGPLLFYCKPAEKHESARAIDVRMSSVRLSPRDSVAARERSYSLAVQSPERLFEVAPADVAGAEIECYQWIFALRAATTRHVILAPETAGSAKQKAKRRGESETLRRTDGHLRALDEILRHKYNMRCHDCSADAINWVSMTSGAVLCDACASVHVQLPKGVSQLRSIGMSKWDDETVVQFRQANLAVLKRLRAAAGDDESGVPAAGTDSTPLTPRSDVFAVAANSVVRQSSGSPVKRELRRPSPNATFAARSAYIARLYCTLADARKPPSLTPLDSMDGFLWRRPSAVAAWRRETFRLRGSNLDFEKAKAIGHTVETISLQAAEIRAPRTSDRAHAFDLVTPTRIYSLAADDQDELCRWCLAIQFSVESQK
jgi:hypothetical protein